MSIIQFNLSRLWVQGDIGWADVRPNETSAFSSDLVPLDGDFSVTVDGKPVRGIAPPGGSVSLGDWLRQLHPLYYST